MNEHPIDHSAHMNHDTIDAHMNHDTIDHSQHQHHNNAIQMGDTDLHAGHNLQHMMSMTFHFGYKEVILFDQWSTESIGGLIGSMIVIFIAGALYEGLKYYREYLFWKTYNSLQYRAVTVADKGVAAVEDGHPVVHMVGEVVHKQPPSMFTMIHCFQTLLHILQVTVSFLLMLIFMTYNVWLCLAVVLGAATGFFLFGWKKSVMVDVTEHCH